MHKALDEIRTELKQLLEENSNVPELEKLERAAFVIDHEERERLLEESNVLVQKRRVEIQEINKEMAKEAEKIKKNCWDTMLVPFKRIKSFNDDHLLGRPLQVGNFPIRKETDEEIKLKKKLFLLRKVAKVLEDEKRHDTPDLNEAPEPKDDIEMLLFEDHQTTSDARKRIQSILLNESVNSIKAKFNSKFDAVMKMKQDELAKVEGLLSRIAEIHKELGVKDLPVAPTQDDIEVPERILKVRDEEIKATKWLTPEEKAKIELRKQQEAAKNKSEDNGRKRALIQMMNGTLEERYIYAYKRSKQETLENIIKPECANKPVAEMTEEERKLVKEWEKKVAFKKEEDEKYRKSLESEMKKLLNNAAEIYVKFDAALRELQKEKFKFDVLVLKTETKALKLIKCCVEKRQVEKEEASLHQFIEMLKVRKAVYASEIPEVKKGHEKLKEDHEKCLKREKDLDKVFKKEFDANPTFISLFKPYFKLRLGPRTDLDKYHPFVEFDEAMRERFKTMKDDEPPILQPTEEVPAEVISKFMELREKRVLSELDTLKNSNKLEDVQFLVHTILDQNERIKANYEEIQKKKNLTSEKLMEINYDYENLYEMKWGQIEIQQQPVVTSYANALLIHRSVVEKLNESIQEVGRKKVDALNDMKNYRKGIHQIEWETQVLDFKAEELVSKARDVQLLRVTRDIQEYLRSGDDQKQMNEIAMLERQIQFYESAHANRVNEKKKALEKIEAEIAKKKEATDKLIGKSAIPVDLQKKLDDQLNLDNSKRQEDARVMQDIMFMSDLKKLRQMNEHDIKVLKEELVRLHAKTVPILKH